jgi:hypothetical protein
MRTFTKSVLRVLVVFALLPGCGLSLRQTATAGVAMLDGCYYRDGVGRCQLRCARSYDAEASATLAAVLAETTRRGLLGEHTPLAVCIVNKAPPIPCGIPVYGCAAPKRDRLALYVAGRHPQWRKTLAHEALCALAYVGALRGWPRDEADVLAAAKKGTIPYAVIRDAAAKVPPKK